MQVLLNGAVYGSALALLAAAFQVVYLPTGVFFIALAAIYTAAPYLVRSFVQMGAGWPIALVGGVCISTSLCIGAEWANHAPLTRRRASPSAHLVASLGCYILLVQLITMIWGSDTKTLVATIGFTTRFMGITITASQWLTLIVASTLLAAYVVLLLRAGFGLRLRALADNPIQFALAGYNVSRHRMLAFGLAGALAAAASLVTAFEVGVQPYAGLHMLLLAMVSVIVGGRGSFIGPILGAVLIGLLRNEVAWHLSPRWDEAFTFALLSLFLLMRPQGLLGGRSRIEAAL